MALTGITVYVIRPPPPTTAASAATTVADTSEGACSLLAATAINAALKITVGEGTSEISGDDVTTCTFAGDDGVTTVRVIRYEPAGDLIANTLAGDPNAKALPGVGDEAVEQFGLGRQVTLTIGDVGVQVSVTPAPTLETMVLMARQAGGAAT